MNFLKRAVLAVTRKKGKSIIMFIIFAAIANLVLAGFAIQHATQAASENARKQIGGQITLMFDMQKARQAAEATMTSAQGRPNFQSIPVTEDMVQMVAKQKDIISYNCLVTVRGGVADGFSPVVQPTPSPDPNSANNQQGQGNFGGNNGGNANFVQPNVGVSGVSSTELSDAFNSGGATLLSGRHIQPEDIGKNVAMIEQHLADQNNLKVGSKIKIKATRSTNEVEFTIVGIYQASQTASNSDGGFDFRSNSSSDPYNMIYTDYKSLIPLQTVINDDGTTTTGGISSAIFYLDDPKNTDAVKADINAMKIDWNTYTIDANDTEYQQMVGPINSVAKYSMIVVLLVGIAGAVILALILMLSIKERMYETGVLLAMGEAKLKVISQYVAEVLIIAIIAFGLSAFSGSLISQSIGDSLLKNQIQSEQTQANNNQMNGFGGRNGRGAMFGFLNQRRNANVKQVDSISVTITPKEVGQTSGVGLLIIMLGTILPAATVMRYKPKAILTKAT